MFSTIHNGKVDNYDVVIVGAGPAGASCARELSKKGKRVLLIEKSKEIGEPNFSSVGTPDYLLEEFELPQNVVGDYWDKIKFVTPTGHEIIWRYDKTRGYVLKFNELKKFLVEDAANHGCTVYVGTVVKDAIVENNGVKKIRFAGVQEGEVEAPIVVDASGPEGIIASKVGLRQAVLGPPTPGLEFIMTDVTYPMPHSLDFYIGSTWVPRGYAWIFPMGERIAKVGIASYGFQETPGGEPLLSLLKKFISRVPWLKGAQEMELHGSTIFLTPGIDNYVWSNVITIGDAASQINSFAGEGVRHALRSGRMAAEAIQKALEQENSSLSSYNDAWKKYIGNKWKLSFQLSVTEYAKLKDEDIDKALQVMSKLNPDELFDIFFDYKFERFLRLTPYFIGHFPLTFIKEVEAIMGFG